MHWYVYCRWSNGCELRSWANPHFSEEFQKFALQYGEPAICESRCKKATDRPREDTENLRI